MELRKRQPLYERVLTRAWTLAAPLVARIVWLAGKPEGAQARAFAFARRFEAFAGLFLGKRADGAIPVRVHVMNALISKFCGFQRGFPVDFDLTGDCRQLLPRPGGRGILLVTVHTKLGLAANAALRSGGRGPVFVGYPPGNLRTSSWGTRDELEYIDANDPTVFLKVHAAIEDGRIVVAFPDFGKSNDGRSFISSNLFHWADQASVPIMHSLSTLGDGGQIRIELAAEPQSAAGADARARAFVDFLGARWARRFAVCRPKELERVAASPGPARCARAGFPRMDSAAVIAAPSERPAQRAAE